MRAGFFHFGLSPLPDVGEIKYGLDPQVPNASQYPDGDGVSNWRELAAGTNSIAEDTDFDGSYDLIEVSNGSGSLDPDSMPGN